MTTAVVVTGGSSGIGRALLASNPHADAVTVDVSRSGGEVAERHWELDLALPASWSDFGRRFKRLLEEVDPARIVVVHAAGVLTPLGFAAEVDRDAYDRNIVLNAAAAVALGGHALAAMSGRHGRGTLCLLSSGAATSVYPGWSSYCAGKAAVEHWVRVVGEEQQRRGGVEVAAVAPGVVDTPMQDIIRGMDERDFPAVEKFRTLHDEGRLRAPGDVARQLWSVIEAGFTSGDVLDLRDLDGWDDSA